MSTTEERRQRGRLLLFSSIGLCGEDVGSDAPRAGHNNPRSRSLAIGQGKLRGNKGHTVTPAHAVVHFGRQQGALRRWPWTPSRAASFRAPMDSPSMPRMHTGVLHFGVRQLNPLHFLEGGTSIPGFSVYRNPGGEYAEGFQCPIELTCY